ncbi:unnamed protein product, partial [Eruca vesicaria subsp. sativa]|nr:unnamed protein product [Eruca vesicaria subsp. sativa]
MWQMRDMFTFWRSSPLIPSYKPSLVEENSLVYDSVLLDGAVISLKGLTYDRKQYVGIHFFFFLSMTVSRVHYPPKLHLDVVRAAIISIDLKLLQLFDHQDMAFVFLGHGFSARTPLYNSITNCG